MLQKKLVKLQKNGIKEVGQAVGKLHEEIKMHEVVIHLVINNLIYLIAVVVYLRVLIKKKRIIKWEQAPADTRNMIKRHEKRINFILKIIIGVGVIFGLFYSFILYRLLWI